MKNYLLIFSFITIIASCSSLPKKNKRDNYIPKIETKRIKNIDGQISTINCSNKLNKIYTVKFNRNKDSLIFKSSIDFCELYKEDLKKGKYIISIIDFRPKEGKDSLNPNSFNFGVFDENKKLKYEFSRYKNPGFVIDEDLYKKSFHYKFFSSKFKILKSTIPLDSISKISMVNKFIKN